MYYRVTPAYTEEPLTREASSAGCPQTCKQRIIVNAEQNRANNSALLYTMFTEIAVPFSSETLSHNKQHVYISK